MVDQMDEAYIRQLKGGHDDGVPRDMAMQELRVGDHVLIPCRVEKIRTNLGGKFQNIEVVTDETHFPWKRSVNRQTNVVNDAKTRFSPNSRQVIKDSGGDQVERLQKALADANRTALAYEAECQRLKQENELKAQQPKAE